MNTFQNSFGSQFYSNLQKQQPCFGLAIPQKQFKRSQNVQPQFGLSNYKQKLKIKQLQFQQKIILLKVQLQFQTVFDLFQSKVCNKKRNAFKKIAYTKCPQQISYTQQKLSFQYANEIVYKMDDIVKRQQIKMISEGFKNIVLRNALLGKIQKNVIKNQKKVPDKRTTEMIRMNSKVEQNRMRLSDLGIDGQITNHSSIKNPLTINKQLKKRKHNFDKNINDLYSQMNQILSAHEQYINKK